VRIALVHTHDGSDVRIGKMCRSLSALGHDVHFVGWDKRPQERKDIDLGAATAHVLELETTHGKTTASGYRKFYAHVLGHLARLRPRVVCAVNEDNALVLLPFKRVLYRYLVCDVFDALSDRHSEKSAMVKAAAALVATTARWGADRLIATDDVRFERFGRFRGKTTIIENFPEDPGPALSRALPTGPVKIWVAGTLNRRRGLGQLIDALSLADEATVVSAGWAFDDFAKNTFLKHPRVDYRGIVTATEALRLAAECDAVFCFYDPVSVNNRFASPNKVYDALAVGRPVVINAEVGLAAWVEREKLGWSVPYSDAAGLVRILRELAQRRGTLAQEAARLRALFEGRYAWALMEERLEGLYESLSD